jgi:co-chaperonin GroES (HSP10)
MQKIIPRKKWVLIKKIEKEINETKEGIILPANNEQEKKAQGVIEAIGDEVNGLGIGDTVIYGMFADEQIKVNENGNEVEYSVVLDEDIIATIKEI